MFWCNILFFLAWAEQRGYHTAKAGRPDTYRAGKKPIIDKKNDFVVNKMSTSLQILYVFKTSVTFHTQDQTGITVSCTVP